MAPKQSSQGKDRFPGLKPAGTTQYQERQKDELTALESIYGDDFRFVEQPAAHSAWKKSEPSFEIRVRSSDDDGSFQASITLRVVMTATYPKSPPLLSLRGHDVDESSLFKAQKFVDLRSKELAKEATEMVLTLIDGIRDILEDAAASRAKGIKLPSLEEERAAHEAMVAKLANDEREKDERKRLEETKEEERALGALIEQERDRQRAKAKESRRKIRSNRSPERVVNAVEDQPIFDEPCSLTDSTGNTVYVQVVTGKALLRKGPLSTVYSVQAAVSGAGGYRSLAVKQTELQSEELKQVQSLEAQLKSLKELPKQKAHKNVLEVLDFKINRAVTDAESGPTTWIVSTLSLLADQGSLQSFLSLGRLDVNKVRAWTRDLLDALNYLHSHNIFHQDIHPSNILLFSQPTGDVVPKLADAAFQQDLYNFGTKSRTLTTMKAAKSAYWFPPEIAGISKPQYTQKTDVWDFGVVFLQMVFGLDVPEKYHSPRELMESFSLSDSLAELVSSFFTADQKKRPRAFDLGSSEFLARDAPILLEDSSAIAGSLISLPQSLPSRQRRDSGPARGAPLSSRYQEDFIEEGRLGKGGFGEVVKARKKLDGLIYAIKKITITQQGSQSLTVTDILKEVRLLSQVSHPAVVRYYDAWLEETPDFSEAEGDTSTEGYSEEDGMNIEFTQSLDFMSSRGYPAIEFASDDTSEDDGGENEDEEDSSDSDDDSSQIAAGDEDRPQTAFSDKRRARRGSQRPFRTVMYISMEHCEKRTLRDLITRNLSKEAEEIGRLFRQILEGLAHIHGLGIVHRDLKPENVFIGVGVDGGSNVKIGDFGLATKGQLAAAKGPPSQDATDETRSIGTSVYVAPEVRSGASGSYTSKVDMYSLGVIFFEMCYQPMLGMQRADVLSKLRSSPPALPPDFKPKEKSQTDIILSLLTHNPRDRPSSAELLSSGKLPVKLESETIKLALAGLSDPNSPYRQTMMSFRFAEAVEQAKDRAWDVAVATPTSSELMRQHVVKDTLVSIFRHHGAVEVARHPLYPRSSLYNSQNIVRMLDQNDTLLQLPYDLTMGHARSLGRNPNATIVEKTYTFGSIFRDRAGGGQPSMFGEADFDIVTTDTLDLALREAEAIKVLDEITAAFPTLSSSQIYFQLGHSDLLQLIFDFCGVEKSSRRAVADVLSRLNIHQMTWQKLCVELRSPLVGASATSIDALQRFDFRDTPSKAFSKLKSIFEGTDTYQKASSTLAHLKEVYEYCRRLRVSNKIYVSPLNTYNESFFVGGIMFSCLLDKKAKDVVAAGGRYDGLIKEHRPKIGDHVGERHAVGFSLNWEKLARAPPRTGGKAFLKKMAEEDAQGIFATKRCEVLVASFDPAILRTTALEVLQDLWAHGLSAELAKDARSPEELVLKHRDEPHSWIVIVKHDMARVKPVGKKDAPDVDIPHSQLASWLQNEVRETDARVPKVRTNTASEQSSAMERDHEQEVRVLVGQTKSKKVNRQAVVDQARQSASRLMTSYLDGPIVAVETSDQVMELMRGTSLSDPESWRKVEQGVTSMERKYTQEIHAMLASWRTKFESGGSRHAFVYNFRSGACIYYDLES